MTTTQATALRSSQFRKKPVVIFAAQWFKNGDHPDDYSRDHDGLEGGELRVFTGAERRANGWEGDVVRYYRHPGVPGERPCEQCGKPHHVHGWIDTLEQGHRVCPGDWIITGVKGERYPCKPDIFEATYEREGVAATSAGAQTRPAHELPAKVAGQIALHEWAVSRWRAEVENRPMANKHRRTLDDAWRQVIRFAGGDPDEAIGPSHDALLSLHGITESKEASQ